MRKTLILFWVLTLALSLNSAFALDESEVAKKTTAINAILDSVYNNPQQKAKYMVVFKEIFQWCAKTCKNEVSKEVSSRILETYDEKYPMWETKTETKTETKKEESKTSETETTAITNDPTQPFTLDWIEYQVLNIFVYDWIWSEPTKYSDYRKWPKNDKWVILEYTAKNVSGKDNVYPWQFSFMNWENQYENAVMWAYAEDQMGYDDNHSTQIKQWAKLKWYTVFDMKESDIWKWILYVEPWLGRDSLLKMDATKIKVVNSNWTTKTTTTTTSTDSNKTSTATETSSTPAKLADADVRNVKWWMTRDEIVKNEWWKSSDILIDKDNILVTKWTVNWYDAEIMYVMDEGKLYEVMYEVSKPTTSKYLSIAEALENKYWNWNDISLYDDTVILNTNASKSRLSSMLDTYLSLWYIAIYHTWEKNWDKVMVNLGELSSWWVKLNVLIYDKAMSDKVDEKKEATKLSDI